MPLVWTSAADGSFSLALVSHGAVGDGRHGIGMS